MIQECVLKKVLLCMNIRRFLFSFLLLVISYSVSASGDTPDVKIYPNPTNGILNLQITTDIQDSVMLKILNLSGQELHHSSFFVFGTVNYKVYRDLRNYINQDGIYFISLFFKNKGYAVSKKIVVTDIKPIIQKFPFSIKHTTIDLAIKQLTNKTITGTVSHDIIVVSDSINEFSFDLLKLQVGSVRINGNNSTYTQNDSILLINSVNKFRKGDSLKIEIDYSGKPIPDATWGGFYFNGNFAFNMGVGFTSNPHSFGRCWFPCIDNFNMKSTYSFRITTDSGWVAVCNGLLNADSILSNRNHIYRWEENLPIPAYLASVAVGKYSWVKMDFKGMLKNYPVWIAAEAKDTANARASMTHLLDALSCFESKFGPYPFERVGYVGVPFNSGAMEHAGNIAYPNYALNGLLNFETLFAHELSHMWWGDQVTCKTPEDMWLNEGWASYCEALFLECLYGKQALVEDLKDKLATVTLGAAKNDGAFYAVSGVPHNATYGTHVYKKGALVAHSLRSTMGDSAFFAACKSYLNEFKFKNANSEDLMLHFQNFTSENLNEFFLNWVYSPGYEEIGLTKWGVSDHKLSLEFSSQSSLRNATTLPVSVSFDVYDTLNQKISYNFKESINHTLKTFDLPASFKEVKYVMMNPNLDYAWPITRTIEKIGNKGNRNLTEQLTVINVTDIKDTVELLVEHHWTEANPGDLRSRGIRISPERYWHFDGIIKQGFSAFAFFNYDGNTGNFLDIKLMSELITEDSLVLLFRPRGSSEWTIHTDHTFQPGTSKTDKVGRFWINHLQAGDYAFGMRDSRVTGLKEVNYDKKLSMLIKPNPANDAINVAFENVVKGTFHLTDVNGKSVLSGSVSGKQLDINTQLIKEGVYYLTIQSNNISTSKMIQILRR